MPRTNTLAYFAGGSMANKDIDTLKARPQSLSERNEIGGVQVQDRTLGAEIDELQRWK
jgi:hypothetical protein